MNDLAGAQHASAIEISDDDSSDSTDDITFVGEKKIVIDLSDDSDDHPPQAQTFFPVGNKYWYTSSKNEVIGFAVHGPGKLALEWQLPNFDGYPQRKGCGNIGIKYNKRYRAFLDKCEGTYDTPLDGVMGRKYYLYCTGRLGKEDMKQGGGVKQEVKGEKDIKMEKAKVEK
ncbi:MAG: hypothetical protein Q9201_007062 [Fulgogasparrea decipioides]